MKTILLPTDFSKASEKAMEYAILIAQRNNARIVVAHAYLLPVFSSILAPSVMDCMIEEVIQKTDSKLISICKKISSHVSDSGKQLECEYVSDYSVPETEIKNVAYLKKPDLIIMGTNSRDNLQAFLRSTTSRIIDTVNFPLLIVHENTIVVPIEKIHMAVENITKDALEASQLIDLASTFKASITLLHVQPHNKVNDSKANFIFADFIKDIINYSSIRLKTCISNNVEEGIKTSLSEDNSDLLVLIKYSRKWLDELFHKSIIRAFIKKGDMPLLILHRA
ncbi:MAG: universal stress protein [Sporocytophaga sp.]|nr:universal stress protein [Sporocytophaga sp.]